MTENNAAQAADTTPFSDEYVNAVIQQHGYDSPECVIARLHQWIGLHGGENGLTLLMYEAHKALVKLHAPVADSTLPLEQALHELIDKIVPGLDTGDLVQDARRASTALSAILASAAVAVAPEFAADLDKLRRKTVTEGPAGPESVFQVGQWNSPPRTCMADPLQGAADWLMRAFEPPLSASDLARRLVIGHNRATRLRDAALASAPVAGEAQPVGRVRHFNYSGIARNGSSQEAVLNDDAPSLPDGTLLYAAPQASEAVRDAGIAASEDVAPWTDFAGNPIKHGDRIRHPEGLEGVVVRLPGYADAHDAWCVAYQDRTVSRLSLQIGERGQAVVQSALSAQPGAQKNGGSDAK